MPAADSSRKQHLFCVLILIFLSVSFFVLVSKLHNYKQVTVPPKIVSIANQLTKATLSKLKNDDSKLVDAATFLTDNIKYHHFLAGEREKEYIDSIDKNFLHQDVLRKRITELKLKKFTPSPVIYDAVALTPGFLENDIRLAWKYFNSASWHDQIGFDTYKEYILPYRIEDEMIDGSRHWRNAFMKRFCNSRNIKILKQHDLIAAATLIHAWLKKDKSNFDLKWGINAQHIPNLPLTYKDKLTTGTCHELTLTTIGFLRSLSIPATRDYVPRYFNMGIGHEWAAVIIDDNESIPFDTQNDSIGKYKLPRFKVAKVFRKKFSPVKGNHFSERGFCPYLPTHLNDPFSADVTDLYGIVSAINIPYSYSATNIIETQSLKYAYLCTFGYLRWTPIDWGTISNHKMHFKKLASGGVFLPKVISERGDCAAADPLILNQDGTTTSLKPNFLKMRTIKLDRKYPLTTEEKGYNKNMIGGVFQGANRPDFSDAVNLVVVKNDPSYYFQDINVSCTKQFRYVRYFGPPKSRCNIAEMEFYRHSAVLPLKGRIIGTPGSMGDKEDWIGSKAFDGKMETAYSGPKPDSCWVGLDLGYPARIGKIRFLARNTKNGIYKGMNYELFYWNSKFSDWVSLGRKIANENHLIYNNVPGDALLWLRNLNEGRDERIFTYSKGAQIWW